MPNAYPTPTNPRRLDPREEHHRVASTHAGLTLFLRRLEATEPKGAVAPVLYVHGATFPSALSVAYRFDGVSWRDALNRAGYDVWAFDFLGFGESDRYPEMTEPAETHPPLCRAPDATRQLGAAVEFVLGRTGAKRVSLVCHSWGGTPAIRFASEHPEYIDRLVLFGPIATRPGSPLAGPEPAWRDLTLADQWGRFVEDVPAGESPVLSAAHFEGWGEAYLASDPRGTDAVRVPSGPGSDNAHAFAGDVMSDPGLVRSPVAIIRGAWDHLVRDDDAARLFDALVGSPSRRDVKISRGTHLMHLETMRWALWRETIAFLDGDDVAPMPDRQGDPTCSA